MVGLVRIVVFKIEVVSVRMGLLISQWSGGRFSMGGLGLLEGTGRVEILGSLLLHHAN